MKRPFLDHKRWRRVSPLVFLVLSLALSACDQGSGNGSGSASVATKPPAASAITAAIQLGPQPCPAAVQAAAHWNATVGTNTTKTVQA